MFFKKKSESGISMVEMLGVLAIIGVLSIGGIAGYTLSYTLSMRRYRPAVAAVIMRAIAGYTLSMRRYRAKQVLDAVNKYALVVYGVCQQALVNGDVKYLYECKKNEHLPSFEDSGLGTVADVTKIEFSSIDPLSTPGKDYVRMHVVFRDNEVCKAARSMLGIKNSEVCSGVDSSTKGIYVEVEQK